MVDIELHMVNQRDSETAFGAATVALPSRETGLPVFPVVPVELELQAAQMFARHNELSEQQHQARRRDGRNV